MTKSGDSPQWRVDGVFFHILFFDRLCSVKAGAFVDVPTGHPLLFCRYEPFLCLPCQHGEEDGLWRVTTLLPTVAGA